MVNRILSQVRYIFMKNFLIMRKNNELIKEVIFPIITAIFLILANNSDNPIYQSFSLIFLPISMVTMTRFISYSMVEEKSTRQKEVQKIMGIKQSSYVLGWLASNLFRVAVVCFVFLILTIPTGALAQNQAKENVSPFILSFGFILFGLGQMSLGYFLSVFFSVPKSAADATVGISVIGQILAQLYSIEYIQQHAWVVYLLNILPCNAFTRLVIQNLMPEMEGRIQFGIGDAMAMLAILPFFYFILYAYLDSVLPSEYGTRKSLCFCFDFMRRKKSTQVQELSLPLQNSIRDTDQDYSSAIYHQPLTSSNELKKSIEIENLYKAFGETKAVNGVSLMVYESQILCLLGHNGAGKTTLISLVTGLVSKDQGSVKLYDKSIDDDLDDIRQITGICPQHDVLYERLTVTEHLQYYGKIKGFSGHALEEEIEYILTKCMLQNEKLKEVCTLSGGNKRKLSLGIALIGKSKIVFLDEPTSGMDPVTRRAIWDILLEMKQENRTMILTTHHLDEAEILSERIAIMAKGKLLTVGSSDFIKKNFGIGYHLSVYRDATTQNETNQWNQQKDKLIDFLRNNLQGAKYNPQTADDTIIFTIPFSQKHSLIPIFEQLEQESGITIDLSLNSLEEAFINIGIDEDNFINKTRKKSVARSQIQSEIKEDKIEYSEFSQIPIPPCISNKPQYYFSNQFIACFQRKFYNTKFGTKLFMQIIFPIYFAFIASLLCFLMKDIKFPEEGDYINIFAIYITIEMSFGFALAASTVSGMPVEERELKLKYALNVMGCRVVPYWLATLAYDCLVFFFIVILLVVLLVSFSITIMVNVGTIFVYLSSCFSFVGISYTISWLYQKANTAYKTSFLVILFFFMLFPGILIAFFQNKAAFTIMTIISPSFSMAGGLLVNSTFAPDILLANSYMLYIGFQLLQGIAGVTLSIYIDTRSLRLSAQLDQALIKSQEEDVINEAQRVGQEQCKDSVKAIKVAKQYSTGLLAVKGTSFGVDQKEILGLLGPNGAGKSTTFNMLTSRLMPSSGQIYLMNQVAEKGNAQLYQNVGICPQFDCIWELLTPIEHLQIYARLKGLKGTDISQAVNYFIRIMQLDSYVKTKAGKLSGGNKRKLCVAIALIGGPNMQFFDEPSSGVDPISRRFLWNTIQQGLRLNNSAVVLTTHSMDEAESLCTKIAIQVNGEFVCYGTPQNLKRKYGSGYTVTLEIIEQSEQVQKMVQDKFPQSKVLQSQSEGELTFNFPIDNFKFSVMFEFFYNQLQQKMKFIQDFNIRQSSLEQVFLHFASFQNQQQNVFVPRSRKFFAVCMGDEDD